MTTRLGLDGLGRLAAELAQLEDGLRYVGARAVEAVLHEAGSSDGAGPDRTLSRFAHGRVRLDAKAELHGSRSITIRGTPPGPWTLIESGSKQSGWLEPRAGSRKVLRLPDGGFRRQVMHGPVRGRRTFTRAKARIEAEAPGWLGQWVNDQIRKAS